MVNGNHQTDMLTQLALKLDEIAHEAEETSNRVSDPDDEGPSVVELMAISQCLLGLAGDLLDILKLPAEKHAPRVRKEPS